MSVQLNEFLQSAIKQKLSSFQKITCSTAISDKKILSTFCISEVLCYPTLFNVQIIQFLQLGSISSWNPQRKRKKLTVNHMYMRRKTLSNRGFV